MPLFGNAIPGAGGIASRQIVQLEGANGRLMGRPSAGPLAVITAYAPGCPDTDIVISQKAVEGHSTLLQMAVPACLGKNLLQATLFFRTPPHRVRFAKTGEGNWAEGRLRMMPPPALTGIDRSLSLPAVEVTDLGLIQLLEEDGAKTSPADLRLPWTADLGTRLGRSAWHILWPGSALAILVLLSWSVHKLAILGDKG
jgi:hypothetical protein